MPIWLSCKQPRRAAVDRQVRGDRRAAGAVQIQLALVHGGQAGVGVGARERQRSSAVLGQAWDREMGAGVAAGVGDHPADNDIARAREG